MSVSSNNSNEQSIVLSSGPQWRSRGYLAHFDIEQIPQFITFRLFDSLPTAVLKKLAMTKSLDPIESQQYTDDYLDRGFGNTFLKDLQVAQVVQENLLWFDGIKYRLHAWAIMPNHINVLITPKNGENLAQIGHSWKSFTAKRVNRLLKRNGPLWQREYFDRFIRDESREE
jgi:hypothetical protein